MGHDLTIWGDLMSQPTRLVIWTSKLLNLNINFQYIGIAEKDQRKESYLKINPFGMVPAIRDEENGFLVYESHTIVRYFVNKYNLVNNDNNSLLYGGNGNDIISLQKKAKIDEYLDWHHTNIRYTFHHFFHEAYLNPKTGETINKELLESTKNNIPIVLNQFENLFLNNGKFKYINNSTCPTLADLSAYCEISQLKAFNFDYSKFKYLNDWMKLIESINHFDEVFKVILNAEKAKF